MDKILINVAWPYANGPIHLGHLAGSLLPPDIFSRYNKLIGNEVLMVGGSDQHGTPITVTAEKEGVTPEEIAERNHAINVRSIEGMGIEFDRYNKTHSDIHIEVTQKVFLKLRKNGYIYDREENEYYCPSCAKFLPDRYVEGICPDCGAEKVRSDQCDSCGRTFEPGEILKPYCTRCGKTPEVRTSKQFALKLSEFEKPLIDLMNERKWWRSNTLQFTKNFLEGGLKDRSITRDMSWGVPIPDDSSEWKEKVIYVWFEAVIGYLSSTVLYGREHNKPELWKDWWQNPNAKHYYFIGKDNIPFHSVIWPAILIGLEEGMVMPYDIPANEYLMFGGKKLSKSRKGAEISPEEQIPKDLDSVLKKFDPEEIRYYLSMVMPDTHDSEFSWMELEQKVNSELVAALGNFYHRTLSFTQKNFGTIPENNSEDKRVTEAISKQLKEYKPHLSNCDFKKGIQDVMQLQHFQNEYFNSCTPWKLVKENKEECGRVLNENLRLVRALCVMQWPYLPKSSEKIWDCLQLGGTIRDAGLDYVIEKIPQGQTLKESVPVYQKIDLKVMFPEIFKQPEASAKKEIEMEKEASNEPFSAFKKLDLRIGKIVSVEDHPDADKLFKLQVDIGEEKPRTICAGLKAYYSKEEMLGRKAIVVSNLQPRPLRGIDSYGMLLAADDEEIGGTNVRLLKPSNPDIPVGTKMNCGLENSSETIDYKKHFMKVTMKVSQLENGTMKSPNMKIDIPDNAVSRAVAVIDGEKAIALSDGKGCYATVDNLPLQDGASVR